MLGENHSDTLISIKNLALLYDGMERYSEGEPLYVECFEKSRAELGENHPDT